MDNKVCVVSIPTSPSNGLGDRRDPDIPKGEKGSLEKNEWSSGVSLRYQDTNF